MLELLGFLRINGEYSFARVLGFLLSVVFEPLMCGFFFFTNKLGELNNVYQFLVLVWPVITTLLLFLIQVLKDSRKLSVKIGEKEYGISTRKTINN
jgi:chromate transport protein ChrA